MCSLKECLGFCLTCLAGSGPFLWPPHSIYHCLYRTVLYCKFTPLQLLQADSNSNCIIMLPLHSAILGSPTQTLHQWHYNRTTLLLLGTEGPILGPRDTEGPTWSPRQTCLRQFTKYMIAANELASLSRVQMMYLLYTADKVCTLDSCVCLDCVCLSFT